jgi:hypothetical protein
MEILFFPISSLSPTCLSMATATGHRIAPTTTFGRNTDKTTDTTNHTITCWRTSDPIMHKAFTAMRRSSPHCAHETVSMSAPIMSRMIGLA